MKECSHTRVWRGMLLYAVLLLVALPLSACATTPGVAAKNMQPLGDATTAFITQSDLWVTLHGVHARQLTHLQSTTVTWSTLYWSPDTTQLAATLTDPQAPEAASLVIANALTGTAAITPRAFSRHQRLAGWITGDLLLLAGDESTPGLGAYDIATGATTPITTAPVATFTLAAGAVWFVGQQQHPGTGALLSRWGAGTTAMTIAAFLPGFAIAADGTACGRIHLTADGALILYDSLFDASTAPCPHPLGAQMMALESGMAWSVFDTLHAPAANTIRAFLLDPAGQWAAALDIAPTGAITAHIAPTNATAPPATLPTITLAGADARTLTLVQNMLTVTAPGPQTGAMTAIALLPTDGSTAAVTSLAATDIAFAPSPTNSVTAGTDAITCPANPPTDAAASRIAIIGDSLAQGYGTTMPTQCSFAAQLGALRSPLTAGRLPSVMIRGMGGFRVDQMLVSVPDLVAFTPDIAVVELGTNDERESWPLDQTKAAYDTILATLSQAPGKDVAHPIIACLSLWPSPDFDAPTQIAPYNALIAQECDRFGGRYVDITPLATTGMTDGAIAPDFNWHPNDRGGLNLARLIMSTLATPRA